MYIYLYHIYIYIYIYNVHIYLIYMPGNRWFYVQNMGKIKHIGKREKKILDIQNPFIYLFIYIFIY